MFCDPDAEYVEAISRRDNSAYKRLLGECQEYAKHLTPDKSTQDELAQLTTIKVMEKFDSFDQTRQLKRWWISIQRNIWYELCQKNRRALNFTDFEYWSRTEGNPGGWIPDPKTVDPLNKIITEERLEIIGHGPNTINDQERAIIQVRHAYGSKNTLETTALALGIPDGTVKSSEHYAREKLRKKLEII